MTHKHTVGEDVDCWCTRCKLILAHTVESMIGSRITRVHCKTCRSQHTYRPHAPGEHPTQSGAARPPAPRATRATPRATHVHDYAALLSGRDTSTARAYATQDRFAPKELILHPTFGLGVVMMLKDRTKIDVLFRDGMKTLLHSH